MFCSISFLRVLPDLEIWRFMHRARTSILEIPMVFFWHWWQLLSSVSMWIGEYFWRLQSSNLDEMADCFHLRHFCCSTLELAYEFKNSFLFPRVQNMGDSMPLTIVATNQMDEQIHRVSIYIQQWQKEILMGPNRSCEGKGTEAVIWFAVFSMFFGFRRLW